jgi:hypothetical protein
MIRPRDGVESAEFVYVFCTLLALNGGGSSCIATEGTLY